ncbi:radical SAM family heme chaperone HemW [Desulfothermobacter acidiphilus]|uniref:radical SAM family heme chaperone HemW n=1 Tax=Desulfothermobacter acidiphilus TaxID=1938353 RepID=UPI003F8C216F
MSPAGLYLHVPFCLHKCAYCDFVSYPYFSALAQAYLEGLRCEVSWWRRLQDNSARFATLYLGGGTPTCLPFAFLEEIFNLLRQSFSFLPRAEVTIEANPETFSAELARRLKDWGVNRVSIGMQALRPEHLRLLGRGHTFKEVVAAVDACHRVGLTNINLDLIYGFPGQSLADWREALRVAVELGPTHISTYALELEEHTPLGRQVAAGKISLAEEEAVRAMYLEAIDVLESRGYRHYELSNFARPGRECRHNLGYWRLLPYLGLGPAAHSFWAGKRWANAPALPTYLDLLSRGLSPVVEETVLSSEDARSEAMILGLRLRRGVHRSWFAARFGVVLEEVYGPVLQRLQQQGLLEWEGGWLRLSREALPVANQALLHFV